MKSLKQVVSGLFGAMLLMAAALPASATTISASLSKDPDAPINASTPFNFGLSFPGAVYDPLFDLMTQATFWLRLTDSTAGERYRIVLGSNAQTVDGMTVQNNTQDTLGGTTVSFLLNSTALTDLAGDGALAISVRALDGAFYFAEAGLSAEVTRSANVPEPLTAALLAVGLLGIGAARRQRRT
jgi:hypothetical protein